MNQHVHGCMDVPEVVATQLRNLDPSSSGHLPSVSAPAAAARSSAAKTGKPAKEEPVALQRNQAGPRTIHISVVGSMPLGKRSDCADAKYAGVEVPFSCDIVETLEVGDGIDLQQATRLLSGMLVMPPPARPPLPAAACRRRLPHPHPSPALSTPTAACRAPCYAALTL